jgi:hypothetical protein
MNEHFDALARQIGGNAPRRRVLRGLGALAFGALGLRSSGGFDLEAEARKNKNRQCNNCKHKCKRKNRNKNKKNKRNCGNKCRNKCR